MRLLNMRDLAQARGQYLAHHARLGSGSFATVYADRTDEAVVRKITVDRISYALLADGYWLQVREPVDAHFPQVYRDFGEVGCSQGLDAYMADVERLSPVTNPVHRKLIRRWTRDYSSHLTEAGCTCGRPLPAAEVARRASIEWCEQLAVSAGAFSEVFSALGRFISDFGGALDLKPSNFMERNDGTLVWNDVVFDIATYHKAIRSRCH